MKKILISFLAGAALGILYAPAKGSKTRKKLAGIGDGAKNKWNTITDTVADKIETLQYNVNNIADKAVEKVESTQFKTDTQSV